MPAELAGDGRRHRACGDRGLSCWRSVCGLDRGARAQQEVLQELPFTKIKWPGSSWAGRPARSRGCGTSTTSPTAERTAAQSYRMPDHIIMRLGTKTHLHSSGTGRNGVYKLPRHLWRGNAAVAGRWWWRRGRRRQRHSERRGDGPSDAEVRAKVRDFVARRKAWRPTRGPRQVARRRRARPAGGLVGRAGRPSAILGYDRAAEQGPTRACPRTKPRRCSTSLRTRPGTSSTG